MTPLSKVISDALRYWEPRRLAYNLLLALITLYHALPALMKDRDIDWLSNAMGLFVLAVIANILYCFAYIPDILIQLSEFRDKWIKARIGLFLIGCALAACFAWWISDGMFAQYGR